MPNIGELWALLWRLKNCLFQTQFLPLLFQGTVVVIATAITILASPIARFALRSVDVISLHPVQVFIARAPDVEPIGIIVLGKAL